MVGIGISGNGVVKAAEADGGRDRRQGYSVLVDKMPEDHGRFKRWLQHCCDG